MQGYFGQFFFALRQDLVGRWPGPGLTARVSTDVWLLGLGISALALAVLLWGTAGAFAGFHAVNAVAPWAPDGFWGLTTSAGDGLILGVLGLFMARRYPHVLWILFIGILVAGLLTHLPKAWIDLPRPAGVLEAGSFYLLGPELRTKGPPSGHAVAVFTLAGIVVYVLRNTGLRLLVLAVAVLIAISRVVVGAHWPLDVLMGGGLGLIAAWIAIALGTRFPWGRNPWVHLGLLGFFVTAALMLMTFDPGYPLGRELSVLVAASALLVVVRQYFIDPPGACRS